MGDDAMRAANLNILVARYQCQIYASVARIEGMKAENNMRAYRGEAPAYGEGAFQVEARDLQNTFEAILSI